MCLFEDDDKEKAILRSAVAEAEAEPNTTNAIGMFLAQGEQCSNRDHITQASKQVSIRTRTRPRLSASRTR